MIFLFVLFSIQCVSLTQNEVTVASHSGIDETHLSIDLCVYEDGFVNKRLQFVLFLLAHYFNQSLVLENHFKWNLVITQSLRCIHEASKTWVNKGAIWFINQVL